MIQKILILAFSLISLLGNSGASYASFLKEVKVKKTQNIHWKKILATKKNRRANITGEENTSVAAEITARKTDLIGKEFIYGASLQFVTRAKDNPDQNLTPVTVLGTAIVRFQLLNERLLLIEDNSGKSESDVNNPARLIFEFPVKKIDEENITFIATDASRAIKLFLGSVNNQRSSWLRSIEYVPESKLFLIESSLEIADNSVSEFLEFITPREQYVNKEFKVKYDDIALEKNAERFRLISAPFWINHPEQGRINTKVAQRFNWKPGTTIDWWTTANAPDDVIPLIQTGIEGWNRYSQKMWQSDIVKFRGRLPDNIHVGDPRYNIVVWDSAVSGDSAWESQGADPLTGMQTHSIIYLPKMWLEEGIKFWQAGGATEEKSRKYRRNLQKFFQGENFLGKALPVHCISSAIQYININSLKDPQTFGKDLVKTTLFHEAGHALGFGHNFKGSHAWNFADVTPLFSSSIMEYNRFNEETGAAYESTESFSGPILEYDRQMLSFLYNEGKDIADSDPILPSCDESGTDIREGGIDPTCTGYDLGKNPVETTEKNIALMNDENATFGRTKSWITVLRNLGKSLPSPEAVASDSDLKASIESLKTRVQGVATVYSQFMMGRDLPNAIAMLRTIHPDAKITDANEIKMRDGSMQILTWAANLNQLPEPILTEFKNLNDQVVNLAKNVKYPRKLNDGVKEGEDFTSFTNQVEKATILAIKSSLLGALKYSELAPFVIVSKKMGESIDLEEAVVRTVGKIFEDFQGVQKITAVETLKTFENTESGKKYLERAKIHLKQKINEATNTTDREQYRKVLALIEK